MLKVLLNWWAPTDWGWCWRAHRSLCRGNGGPPRKTSSPRRLRGKAPRWTGPHCSEQSGSSSRRCSGISPLEWERHASTVQTLRRFIVKKDKKTKHLNYTYVTSSSPFIITHPGCYSQSLRAWRPWRSLRRSERCAWWACSPLGVWRVLWSAAPWRTCPSDLHIQHRVT